MKQKGTAYGVGVGPGDPELMSLQAVRLIRENQVIAVPGRTVEKSMAYRIAVQSVPELTKKELIPLYMPMVRDREQMELHHRRNAATLERYLDQGRNVVYLTLGDPTIYSSFSYLQRILERDGYPVELASGIPSFCAAAARLRLPLAEGNEALHILPALPTLPAPSAAEDKTSVGIRPDRNDGNQVSAEILSDRSNGDQVPTEIFSDRINGGQVPAKVFPGGDNGGQSPRNGMDPSDTYVLMKSASRMKEIKSWLEAEGRKAQAVLHCGMGGERLCRSLEEIPEDAGYFTLIISKRSH